MPIQDINFVILLLDVYSLKNLLEIKNLYQTKRAHCTWFKYTNQTVPIHLEQFENFDNLCEKLLLEHTEIFIEGYKQAKEKNKLSAFLRCSYGYNCLDARFTAIGIWMANHLSNEVLCLNAIFEEAFEKKGQNATVQELTTYIKENHPHYNDSGAIKEISDEIIKDYCENILYIF